MGKERFIIYKNSIEGIKFRGKIINLLCLFYLLLWTLVPAFRILTNQGVFRVLFGAILLLWILTAVENLPKQHVVIAIILAGSFFAVMGIYDFIKYGDIEFYDMINYILLIGFAFNGMLYCRINSKNLDLIILTISFPLLFFTTISTIVGLYSNGNAARLLTSSSTNESVSVLLQSKNIGSFDFIYGLVIVFPALILAIKKSKSNILKVSACILAVLAMFCIIKSNFTTALLLLFVAFLLPFIFSYNKNAIIKMCIIILIVIAVPQLLPFFLNYVYSISTSLLTKGRIEKLLLLMNGVGEVGDLSTRVSLFKMSLSSFLHNPFFGVGGYYNITNVANVGKHAQFIDDFARYGLIGGVPLSCFLIFSIKQCVLLKNDKNILKSSMFPSIVIFVMLGFLNPIYNYGILTVFFIICTTLTRYLDREANILNE